ncbi:hypothetical protein DDE83_002462 [Stemphylium lycopersici]|uniref:DUF7607 domain-containing protein n=1 Tax=Stemphylium lycopersici TaxID=183478 RepID=A0A364NA49_STELY|nr:hypothetical protein DDE83_002462 [Stemphylium lycopersici]
MPNNDPWLWSVDELVAQVCHSHKLFETAWRSTTNVPSGPALETELRARHVTGRVFLTSLDTYTVVVRNELNIPQLAHRVALMSVVGLLRQRSSAYQLHSAATTGVLQTFVASRDSHLQSTQANGSRKRRKVEPVSATTLPQTSQTYHASAISNNPSSSEQSKNPTDEFEHLFRWENTVDNDEIIDFAAEDSLEDEENGGQWDAAEEDYDTQDDELTVEVPSQTGLTTEEVVEIINRRIEDILESWKPPKTADPESLWNEAEASGERVGLAQKHEANHAYYSERLDRLCDQIVQFPGSNAVSDHFGETGQVWRQCSNLEVTIDSMEHASWLRDIYKLEPVADSDDEHEGHDNSGAREMPLPQPQLLVATEIIDLGTPSESSNVGERNASPFDPLIMSEYNNNGNPIRHHRRSLTPDSVIADSIEPTYDECGVLPNPNTACLSSTLPLRIPTNHGDEPEKASISSVRRWQWTDLAENLDRKRIVSKALLEMKPGDRELVRSRIRLVGKIGLLKEVGACVSMLRRGETKLPGTLLRDMPKIMNLTNMFLSWWFCRNYSNGHRASTAELEELKHCIDKGSAGTTTFYNYVYTVMGTTFSEQALQHPERPSQAEIIEISDDDD